ncbi:MAG: hypothetical protein WC525_02590 [Candidatus Thermoplasmatota archaeon]
MENIVEILIDFFVEKFDEKEYLITTRSYPRGTDYYLVLQDHEMTKGLKGFFMFTYSVLKQ